MKNPLKIMVIAGLILAVIGLGSAFATNYWPYMVDYSQLNNNGAIWNEHIDMQGEFTHNTHLSWPNMFYHDASNYGSMDPAVDWRTYDASSNGEFRPAWETLTNGQTYTCIANTQTGAGSGTEDTGSHSLNVWQLYYYHGLQSNVGTSTISQPYTVT